MRYILLIFMTFPVMGFAESKCQEAASSLLKNYGITDPKVNRKDLSEKRISFNLKEYDSSRPIFEVSNINSTQEYFDKENKIALRAVKTRISSGIKNKDYFIEVEETDGTPNSSAIYSLYFDNDSCTFKGVLFKPGRKKETSSLNSHCDPTSSKSFLEPSARRICAAIKESFVAKEGGKRKESTNATRSGTQ